MKKSKGFTLIELMITVALIAILAAVAFPSYKEYIRKGRRVDGKAALLDAAQTMERWYTENMTFVGATVTPATSLGGDYTLSLVSSSATAYQLQATPSSTRQTGDSCGSYLLDNTGVKGVTGGSMAAADCW